jgi:hypothetical protein
MLLVIPAKETNMSKDTHIADIVVHLHPETSCDDREKVEEDLRAHNGVISVHFNEEDHPHAVVVAYNTEAITSDEVLAEVRKCDTNAVMAGL